ncbi:poly(U)-specific 3'-to-5' RNA exonuclease [Actinomortierella wolfii]|nr:poly(U)-specific 3'-to-5' RNA exonuclease [Actinomortierella wolfii]
MSLVQYGSSSSDESSDEGHVSSNANVSLNNRLKAETEAVQKGVKRSREEEGDSQNDKKRGKNGTQLPPLPPALTGLFQERERPPDDPSLHQGRTRSKPHVDGLWATSVYIDISLTEELEDIISTLVERAKALVPSLETIPEPHISLTRLFRLPTLHVDRFKRDVRSVFEKRNKIKLSFSGLQCFSNDEQTRSFLTLRVGSGHAELESMMADMDQIAIKYGQPTFYDNPEFHASFAWALGGHTLDQSTVEGILHQDNIGEIHKELDADIRQCVVQAERVSWKIGAKIESLALK